MNLLRAEFWLLVGLLIGGALMALLAGCTPVPAAVLVRTIDNPIEQTAMDGSPVICRPFREEITRSARLEFGLRAPVAALSAQLQQESGCNCAARSPVGAEGCAQFMPRTAAWIVEKYPDLGPAAPFDPKWAIRAQHRYMRLLTDEARQRSADECNTWAFGFVGYNGGSGWRVRDQDLAIARGLDPTRYFDNVEKVNSGRNAAAFAENRGYVQAILRRQPAFALWGASICST